MTQLVFVDANVLYSRTTRDWLFMLRQQTEGSIFHLRTSWDVIYEAGARLRDHHPEADSNLITRFHTLVADYVDELVTDFPGGPVEGMADREDWHVHHAATQCGAAILLTDDRGFLSDETLYEACTCDDFFLEVGKSTPEAVKKVASEQAAYWGKREGKQPPEALRRAGCPQFADMVLDCLRELAISG